MFDLKKAYGFDLKKAEAGVKFIVGADPEKDFVLVKRLPSPAYRAKLSQLMIQNKRTLDVLKTQDATAAEKLDADLLCEAVACTVLAGWGPGITDNGTPVEFSPEAAKEILIKYPQFRGDIIDFAATISNFQADVEEIKKK